MALCSLSTGRIATPRGARRVHHQAAGHHQHFLVGERDGLAGVDRRQHRLERRRCPTTRTARGRRRDGWPRRPARRRPTPVTGGSGRRGAARAARAPSAVAIATATRAIALRSARRSSAAFSPAARPTTRTRSGCASATASALVPMDPVAPRMATRVITAEPQRAQVEERRGEQQRVDAIEHAAVSGNQRRAVLHPGARASAPTRRDRRRCRRRRCPGRRPRRRRRQLRQPPARSDQRARRQRPDRRSRLRPSSSG